MGTFFLSSILELDYPTNTDICPVKTLRLMLRSFFFVGYTLIIVAEIWARNTLQSPDIRRSMRIRQRWARRLLAGLGLEIKIEGPIPVVPCLLVANHRSYLDPILMLQHVDAYPVAKAELASWPLIGKGAKMAGILYLRRESAGSRTGILRQMSLKLIAGFSVIVFPEGTTSSLPNTLPFKKGAFKLAAQENFPILPVAIHYADSRDFWIGKTTFLAHARRRFGERKISVILHYGPEMRSNSADELIEKSQHWIDETLRLHQNSMETATFAFPNTRR